MATLIFKNRGGRCWGEGGKYRQSWAPTMKKVNDSRHRHSAIFSIFFDYLFALHLLDHWTWNKIKATFYARKKGNKPYECTFSDNAIFSRYSYLKKTTQGEGEDSNKHTWCEKIDAISEVSLNEGNLEHFNRDHQSPGFWDLRTNHPWLMCPDPRMHAYKRWTIATAISRNLGFPINKSSAHLTHMSHGLIKYCMPLQTRPNLS